MFRDDGKGGEETEAERAAKVVAEEEGHDGLDDEQPEELILSRPKAHCRLKALCDKHLLFL